jgi:peptidoglycan/LPS O-acetylase OafA/YrhL
VVIGAFDLRMAKYGLAGDLAIVGVRLALSISVATLMWYGFERPILKLKKYFISTHERPAPAQQPALVSAE